MEIHKKALSGLKPLLKRELILGGYGFELNFGKKAIVRQGHPEENYPFSSLHAFGHALYATMYHPEHRILTTTESIEAGNPNYLPVIITRDLFSPGFQPDENYTRAHNEAGYREERHCLIPTSEIAERRKGLLPQLVMEHNRYGVNGETLTLEDLKHRETRFNLKDVRPTGFANSYEIWIDERSQRMLLPDLSDMNSPRDTVLYKFPGILTADPIGTALRHGKEPTLFLSDNPFTPNIKGEVIPYSEVSEDVRKRIARQEYDPLPPQKQDISTKKGFRL